jgi:hypothetical protein
MIDRVQHALRFVLIDGERSGLWLLGAGDSAQGGRSEGGKKVTAIHGASVSLVAVYVK